MRRVVLLACAGLPAVSCENGAQGTVRFFPGGNLASKEGLRTGPLSRQGSVKSEERDWLQCCRLVCIGVRTEALESLRQPTGGGDAPRPLLLLHPIKAAWGGAECDNTSRPLKMGWKTFFRASEESESLGIPLRMLGQGEAQIPVNKQRARSCPTPMH